MGKLQRISKPNDRFIYLTYLPVETIEGLNWIKGDELDFEVVNDALIIRRVD